MSKHCSDGRQRRSMRYIAVHQSLRDYAIKKALAASPTKAQRHRLESETFRRTGGDS